MSYILPNQSEKGPENKEKGYKDGTVTCLITWVTNFQFARYSSQYLLAVTGNYTQNRKCKYSTNQCTFCGFITLSYSSGTVLVKWMELFA